MVNPKHNASRMKRIAQRDGAMGAKSKKSQTCNINECKSESTHHISVSQAGDACAKLGLQYTIAKKSRKVALCRKHYRKIKKEARDDQSMRWESPFE